jgi:hypothetical protein
LVAEVLLFDRVVIPVPPDGDVEEERRWAVNKWQPKRQQRMLDILGDGGGDEDLAVTIPWTPAKRDRFSALSDALKAPQERAQLLSDLRFDAAYLKPGVGPDAFMMTRMLLTREHDGREKEYEQRLPHVWVERVVPAYASFKAANEELALQPVHGAEQASAEVIGWELFIPENSDWSDERTLEVAARLSRDDDYRLEREAFRDWWRDELNRGRPAKSAVEDLVKRADRINNITKKRARRTRVLRSFAVLGGTTAAVGFWFPPIAVAGGVVALVSVGADWILKDETMPATLGPAAMFRDARKHLGWHQGSGVLS